MTAVGVLGGTFDPVHRGHVQIAESVQRVMGLGRMVFMVTAHPPHKQERELTDAFHREAMVRLAIANRPTFELSTRELTPGTVAYTIDTLRGMRADPSPVEPLFCLGLDALAAIHTWRLWPALLAEFDLVVVDRVDETPTGPRRPLHPEVARRIVPIENTAGAGRAHLDHGRPGGRVFSIALPPLPISSSGVRARAAAGGELESLVPRAVAEYIQRTGLYRPIGGEG